MANKTLWPFVIEDRLKSSVALADCLTVTESGTVKLWNGKKLVGVAKQGEWDRVYISAERVHRLHDDQLGQRINAALKGTE